ncbi:uncharacterized protein K452DRAFT_275807 [Aplosporella prunicola CBS 121167]|uniref:Uncharacterized protein n=1 Tax=Aplosporella prunicola CBS 121167 TaxID=1176127 RepID=A0A6A6B8E3_9PEZI|nr:uncharacterized protein K452DRAFT_275807 [Aplosporella prunicola CBS 121167]KAF2139474.1 hypothetical protein K452DRAFT_275807 [Aplosporella prunicola CBS 121167]
MSPFNGDRDAAVLLFGSQVESLSKEALDEIRKSLLDDVSRQWILETLAGLPSWLDALAKALPKVTDAIGPDGRQLLVQLESWLRNGEQDGWVLGRSRVPSVVLAPVVVLAQIAQYRRYLALSQARHASVVAQGKASTLGFCMGLLGAFAVASANNDAEVERYGAVAVRLACVGGALIDAQDEWSATKSFALAWTNSKQKESAEGIVKGLAPEAYMSVLYDEARATITTSERAAARLLRQLRAAGITTAEVGFRGDIHNPASQTKAEVDALIAFCNDNPDLQFPDAASLALPTYTNVGHGQPVASTAGSMHEIAYRTVFEHRCDWFNTFASVKAARLDGTDGHVVAFGPDRCVPQTLTRSLDNRVVHFADGGFDVPVVKQQQQQQQQRDAIAVVGMAIKVAGADDVDEFSDMVKTGESQHVEVSRERMRFETLFREGDDDPSRRWFVNPMRDVDAFDHKFFKRSPRESASMDPQQRLMLQATYQALEQAGYFTEDLRNAPDDGRDRKHVAVYIGAPSVDYEHNVGTHSANAFTSTGNLQTVLTGRVAHHFGWTGPAITLDTACSSSAVAIHMACQSLLTGECNAALAGGVALFTNPTWYQNLAAANFLSPTGQCKPFDEKADGFCRAEGISCVFLKRMSDAVADGNPIFGCINSSAVYQNQNSTPMFVPNSPSLSSLFKDVLKKAKVSPADVSLVEAHGTGTPVGDPAEYDAIRRALRGSEVRSKPIPLGSLKGHIGHTEGASGVASLIKVIAMMREKYIPPQASFTKINPAIKALPSDMLEIVTKLRPWNEDRQKVVLINNYGAGGSNAAMLVTEPPASLTSGNNEQQESRLPFFLSGLDLRSIKAYAAKLVSFLESKSQSYTLADLSFGIDRHSNPDLSQSLVFSCRSVSELKEKISSVASAKTTKSSELGIESSKPERPVILCFGGQVSTFVGLDRKLYESVAVLRNHLDKCDAIIQSQLGLGSMYPDIFSRTPFTDPVRLQTMLFSIQYASAKSWIDCGLSGKVAAVVGHSFGELTALCISGAVSLEDAIKMVGRRAQLIRDSWGSDKGAMMAVEADESLVQELLAESGSHLHGQNDGASHTPAAIACYNGPRSFTLAGSVKCIDAVAETLAKNDRFSAIKNKRLNVTNAFHSSLVDPLVDSLEQVGKELAFQEPSIPLERATETRVSGTPTPEFVADHMRQPVFFNHAIQRLAKDYPSAIFLEAGSNSTITVMANRALMGQAASGTAHHFQAVNITNGGGLDGLTDATTALWKQGLRVSFWAHHAQQTNGYAPLLLPPYQFEKTRHWLERKSMADAVAKAAAELAGKTQPTVQADEQKDDALCKFVGYQGRDKTPRFSINSDSPKYRELLAGHIIAQTAPISPSTLQFDMAIESLFSLHPEWKAAGLVPVLHDLVNHSPLCADQSRVWWLDYKPLDAAESQWEWKISSTLHNGSQTQQHTQGRLHIRSPEDEAFIAEFARFERLVNFAPCAALLAAAGRDGESDDIDVLQGRNIYRAFAEMVDYSDIYRGVRTVIGRGDECAGRVHRRHSGETWVDVLLDDCFSQVSGIWVNLMTDAGDGEMYVSSGCELSMRSPRRLVQPGSTQEHWHVYGRSTKKSDTSFVSDVFVFDASTGQLAQVVLGIQYSKVPMASMSRMLSNLTKDPSVMPQRTSGAKAAALPSTVPATAPVSKSKKTQKKKTKKANASTPKRPEITEEVRKLVANVSGMELGDITLDSQLADIGIDSLMGMEMCREIDLVFKCTVDQGQLLQATSVRQLVEFILKYVPTPASDVPEQEEEEEEGEEEEVEEVFATATTTTTNHPSSDESDDDEDNDSWSNVTPPSRDSQPLGSKPRDLATRLADAERYVAEHTAGWASKQLEETAERPAPVNRDDAVVIVTGASGSLGSHLVAAFAENASVKAVVCVNRHNSVPAEKRQLDALSRRGISLSPDAQAKLRVLETDMSRPQLGLAAAEYDWLVQNGTHVVHNAWPMSATRPIAAFVPQFQTMRSLLDLAREMALANTQRRVGFQLVTSIGVTGKAGVPRVPEERLPLAATLPTGYCEGKWVCERMLDATLHQYPSIFRPMVVRPGQIAGSTSSGYWNPVEHFPFLVKSSQAVRAFPAFSGRMQWVPVDAAAAGMAELLFIGAEATAPPPSAVYHIDNPVGQRWEDVSHVLADAIGAEGVVPFRQWLRLVSRSPLPATENPAAQIFDFLDREFERMSCGGQILDTTRVKEHSKTMDALGPVSAEAVRGYVRSWKEMGFLK